MTLQQFVDDCGGSGKAAVELGVSYFTVRRWINKERQPKGLYAQLLESRGITL